VSERHWRVEVERRASKDLSRLDRPAQQRVLVAIRELAENPRSSRQLRRLRGRPEHRLRVGEWRVLVELDHESRRIVVLRVLSRGRAYER
jgi:mRNA interferase RelE/StbE